MKVPSSLGDFFSISTYNFFFPDPTINQTISQKISEKCFLLQSVQIFSLPFIFPPLFCQCLLQTTKMTNSIYRIRVSFLGILCEFCVVLGVFRQFLVFRQSVFLFLDKVSFSSSSLIKMTKEAINTMLTIKLKKDSANSVDSLYARKRCKPIKKNMGALAM